MEPLKNNTANCGQRVKIDIYIYILYRQADTTLFKAQRVDAVVTVCLSGPKQELYKEAKEKADRQL